MVLKARLLWCLKPRKAESSAVSNTDFKVKDFQLEIYNMVEFRGHQLYFQGNGRITLFKGNNRLLEYEEKWLSQVESKITTDGEHYF